VKTYRLWYKTHVIHEFGPSRQEPYKFTTLEEAQTELVKRVFEYGYEYKIVESYEGEE
jgi:hypothetical protein